MGGSIVLNIIKVTLLGALCVIGFIAVRQYDAFERRILEVKADVQETDQLVRRNAETLGDLKRQLAQGVIVSGGSDGGPGGAGTAPAADPRTSVYWDTPDNVLADVRLEPGPLPDAPRGGTLNFYIGSNLSSLNDHVFNEADLADHVAAFVYEYLARRSFHDPDRFVGLLANRVTMSEDKRVFTIYIRKGMRWHPPQLTAEEKAGPRKWLADLPSQEVTAHDVKFTWDVVRNPLSECGPEASFLLDVESVEVLDDYTVQVTWKQARYYNLGTTLALMNIYPRYIWGRDHNGKELPIEQAAQMFPQHWYNLRMCGTGPFRFDGFVTNQYIRLKRFDDYWGTKPVVDGITLHVVVDADVRLQRFKAGELDVLQLQEPQYRAEVLGGGPGSVQAMIDRGEVELKKWEGATYYYIAWNQRRPIFKERAVRRALAHAFPKERVIRDVYVGLAVAHDCPVHRWDNAHVKDLEQFDFDLAKAARILDEAGWKMNATGVREKVVDGQLRELRFKILLVNSRSVYRDFSLLFQKELAKIGVIMDLDLREWNQMVKQLDDKEYDAVSLGWATSWDSDPEQIWHSRQADVAKGSNHCSYRSDAVDAAIEGLQVEFDPERRKELWRTFQETIVKDQPYLFLMIPIRPWVVNTRVGNAYFSRIRPQIWMLPWHVKAK